MLHGRVEAKRVKSWENQNGQEQLINSSNKFALQIRFTDIDLRAIFFLYFYNLYLYNNY
jgi:hypothetical protein